MTLVDRHIRELKTALWRDLPAVRTQCETLRLADPPAFVAAARRAIEDRDRRTLLAMGQALHARGELTAKPFHKIGFAAALLSALLDERLHDQALELLEHPSIANPEHHKHWTMKARALAGLGRLKQAHGAVRQALALQPSHAEAVTLETALRAAIKLRRSLKEGDFGWASLRRFLEACQVLDLPGEAARFLKLKLKPFPAIAPPELEDASAVIEAAVDLLGPEVALRYARAAASQGDKSPRLQAVMSRCLIELGRAEQAIGKDKGGRELRLQRALALAACGELDEAVERLGRMSEQARQDSEVRAALAWCVGEHVARERPLVFGDKAERPRILNLVPFNDELLLLQLHLAEMADWVDQFVIVESTVTFTGRPKPLHFDRAKAEFSAYADKIRHVVVDGHPPAFSSPWSRDFRQRDLALPALSGLCAPDDLVLLTDVDEVVDRRALEGFEGEFAGLRMAMYRFFLNYRPSADNFPWRPTGAVIRARWLQRFGPSYARFFLTRRRDSHVLDRAGWHFTSIGDSRKLVAKVNSYAHQERESVWRDEGRVGEMLAEIRAGKLERGWERTEIDDSFPRFLRENRESLRTLTI